MGHCPSSQATPPLQQTWPHVPNPPENPKFTKPPQAEPSASPHHTHTPPCLSLRVPLGLRKGEVPRRLAGRPPLARPCHSTPDHGPLTLTASFPDHLFPLPGRPFSRPQGLLFLSPPLSSPHLISPPQRSLSPSLTTTLSQLYGLWALMS